MQKEEINDKKDKTGSNDCGCSPEGQGIAAMMSACCGDKGGFPDCSAMLKSMRKGATDMPCCAARTEDGESEGGRNERARYHDNA